MMLINKLELNTYSGVILIVEDKLKSENIPDDIIDLLVHDIIDNIDGICELINTADKDNIIELLNNI